MALKTVFEETTFETSVYSEDLGCYCVFINPMPFGFDIGSTYHVKWGEDTYECVGIDASPLIPGAAFVGNAAPFGLSGNDEPFCIGAPFDGAMVFLCLTDTEPTGHTVAIYQEDGSYTPSDIIVKDRDGNDVTHEGATRIRTRTADGGTKEFVDADNIPTPVETTVELDFSEGDMEVLPGTGEVFSGVNIPKPVNLTPDNIAEGVDIAGIIGAFAGEGNQEPLTFAYLKYIIPIRQIVSLSQYQLTVNVTFKRTTTERIHVILFPPQTATPSGRYWMHALSYGCDYFNGKNYTIVYASASSTFYSGSGTGATTTPTYYSSGNLTEITQRILFNGNSTSNKHGPSGTYYGFILVTDTAHSGPAVLLRENNYVTGGISVVMT